jgi:phospholipase C
MYDENDGWFDHVPPPTAPHGTEGEYLIASPNLPGQLQPDTLGIAGPLGLGVRVPCLVISPFSRGGHIATETFDHTSQLQLISARFGVEIPNVSKWRRKTVGDLPSALFTGKRETSFPRLPRTSVLLPATGTCEAAAQLTQSATLAAGASVPTKQRMPNQAGGTDPAGKYFKTTREERAIDDAHRTEIVPEGPPSVTTKSAYNSLATVSS